MSVNKLLKSSDSFRSLNWRWKRVPSWRSARLGFRDRRYCTGARGANSLSVLEDRSRCRPGSSDKNAMCWRRRECGARFWMDLKTSRHGLNVILSSFLECGGGRSSCRTGVMWSYLLTPLTSRDAALMTAWSRASWRCGSDKSWIATVNVNENEGLD